MGSVLSPVYESDPIVDLAVSYDYRYLSICYGSGELGILDLEVPGKLAIVARDVAPRAFGWAPDSNALAFAVSRPQRPTQIHLARADEDFVAEVLVSGFDAIPELGWISPGEFVYLTDRDSTDLNLWKLDVQSGHQELILDLNSDIVRLWTSPRHGEAILGLWTPQGPELRRLAKPDTPLIGQSDDPPSASFMGTVAFAPASAHFGYSAGGESKANLFVYDLEQGAVTDLIRRNSEPRYLAISPEGVIIDANPSGVSGWHPAVLAGRDDGFGEWLMITQDPDYLWGPPIFLGERGWGRVAAPSLVLQGGSLDDLGSGKTYSRDIRDILKLATGWGSSGQPRQRDRANAVLKRLWSRERENPARAFSVALARAEFSRPFLFFNPAARWIDRALEMAPEGDASATYLVWQERALIAFCDRTSQRDTRRILEQVPLEMAGDPLLDWMATLLTEGPGGERRAWQKIGRDLRRANWHAAAGRIATVGRKYPESANTTQGLRLIAQGQFEPLATEGGDGSPKFAPLYAEPAFRAAMLDLAARPQAPGTYDFGLKGRLLTVWARNGEFGAARDLVHADLLAPDGSALDYPDMLSHYLATEEQERWMEEAVEDILLSEEVGPLLERDLASRENFSLKLFTLARAKRALIEGEMGNVRDALGSLARGPSIGASSAAEPSQSSLGRFEYTPASGSLRARSRFLERLFWAKTYERSLSWTQTRNSYQSALQAIEDYPRDWDIAAFDLAWAMEMIEAGENNPDILKPLIQIIRGIGDPLINPSHSPPTLRAALSSLDAIAFLCGTADPLYPFIQFVRALCYAGLDNPYVALGHLRDLDSGGNSPGLRNRVLLEEAALRSSLAQEALASRILSDLCARELTPAELTVAIRTRADAEAEAGMLLNHENRLRFLIHEHGLPTRWARTLIPAQTILTQGGEAETSSDRDADSEKLEGVGVPAEVGGASQ